MLILVIRNRRGLFLWGSSDRKKIGWDWDTKSVYCTVVFSQILCRLDLVVFVSLDVYC